MKIQQRLLVSNLLMLILPIVSSLIVIATFILFFNSFVQKNFIENFVNDSIFYSHYDDMEVSSSQWNEKTSIEKISEEVTEWCNDDSLESIGVFVYDKDKNLVASAGNFQNSSMIQSMLDNSSANQMLIDKDFVYAVPNDTYFIFVTNSNYSIDLLESLIDNEVWIIISLLIIIIIIFLIISLTNVFLTRFVFKPINNAMTVILDASSKITSDDLSWRISYPENDEFKPVMDTFNNTVDRLSRLIAEQEHDFENRKELIAGISHDIKTPLTAIKGYVEGLKLGIANTPQKQKEYLEIIEQKTKELERIVSQLFLFSKIDIGELPLNMETIDTGKFVSQFVSSTSDEYHLKGLQLHFGGSHLNGYATVDKVYLRSVLVNILENSLKYGNQADNQSWISQRIENDSVIIRIEDNGPGINDTEKNNIFDVFYRGDKSRTEPEKGSGLGLSIASKTINRFGGTISADNGFYGGLRIEISLPLVAKTENE